MAEPEVTVLMTVRNGEPYLHDAVASILDQTYREFRFLILDNASTDYSRQVVRRFDDRRVDLVELPEDIGQTAALNRGLEMIDSPWVARMDADDISLPRRLELQMAYLKEHPDVVLLGTGINWIDARGLARSHGPVAVADLDLRWELFLGYGGFAHSSVVYRSDAVAEVRGYPAQYRHSQDYGLWCRLAQAGKVANIAETLVRIRRHQANVTEPGLAERERRSVMRSYLAVLLPEEPEETVDRVVDALSYDTADSPGRPVSDVLVELPQRFSRLNGAPPSPLALRDYAQRWLYMARVSSLRRDHSPTAWIKLTLALQPSLLASASLWLTFASVVLAPVRRRRIRSIEASLPSHVP